MELQCKKNMEGKECFHDMSSLHFTIQTTTIVGLLSLHSESMVLVSATIFCSMNKQVLIVACSFYLSVFWAQLIKSY